LVAKGFNQVEGEHFLFGETYCPTLKLSSFRAIIAIAAQRGLTSAQMDVVTAFLIPVLPKTQVIHMKPPAGFENLCKEHGINFTKDDFMRLIKCIYGLKQASHYWNSDLHKALISFGFNQTDADPCVYVKINHDKSFVILATHIDDQIICGNAKAVEVVKKLLSKQFPMKDLGVPKLWTGIQVDYDIKGSIFLSQSNYTEKILKKFKMDWSKSVPTPTTTTRLIQGELLSAQERQEMEEIPYRSAVGSLMWLMVTTRPDIVFAVGQVARFSHAPNKIHWQAVKRIFRYLKGTIHHGLLYEKETNPQLVGWSDADWAGDETRRSTGGYLFFFGKAIISWSSQLQRTISLSSMESEIIQLSKSAQEGIFLISLFQGIDASLIELPVVLMEDNQSAIITANNCSRTKRTKHIDIRHLFVRSHVKDGKFVIIYCPTDKMFADITTKPLGTILFIRFAIAMMVCRSILQLS
jgi:hypothetical protein